jgi:hypothetical protein
MSGLLKCEGCKKMRTRLEWRPGGKWLCESCLMGRYAALIEVARLADKLIRCPYHPECSQSNWRDAPCRWCKLRAVLDKLSEGVFDAQEMD